MEENTGTMASVAVFGSRAIDYSLIGMAIPIIIDRSGILVASLSYALEQGCPDSKFVIVPVKF